MSVVPAIISIGIDPTIEVGPITLAWHGLTIAIAIVVGLRLAAHAARERGLDPERLYTVALVLTLAGMAGAKLMYLLEHGGLSDPDSWLSSRGFTFNGGLVVAIASLAVYLHMTRSSLVYLDAVALAVPLGVAVGRVGDVINGEHYGPESTWPLAVRNTHPDADVPSGLVAYHSGGLYDVLIGLAAFAVVWPLRRRFTTPLIAVWGVLALLAVGRFVAFFYRSDSDVLALGLSGAQWSCMGLLAAAGLGALVAKRWLAVEHERETRATPGVSAVQRPDG